MKKQLLTLSLMIMGLGMFSQSLIWKTHDAAIDSNNVMGCRYLWAVDTNTVWTLFYDGTYTTRTMNKVTVTHDGNTFKSYDILPDTNNFNPSNIVAVNDSVAMVAMYSKDATRNGIVMMTIDSGKTWTNIADTSFMFVGGNNFPDVVHFYDNMNGWCFGDPNGNTGGGATQEFEIYQTTNMGGTWTRVPDANIPNPTSGEYGLTNVYTTLGTQNIWFGTNKGRVYRSTNGGTNWAATSVGGMAAGVEGLAFRDAMHGFVWGINVSGGPIILKKTSNGGATWTAVTITGSTILGTYDICHIPGTNNFMSVGLNPAQSGYVTSITSDDGVNWSVLEAGTTNTERMLKVMMIDSLHGWAGTFADQTSPWTLGMNSYIGPYTCPLAINGNDTICFWQAPNPNNTQLTASGAVNYNWSPTNDLSSAVGAVVTANPTVTTTYTVTAFGANCMDTKSMTVAVLPCTGVGEITNGVASLYPNPSKGNFTIEFANASGRNQVTVTDMIGNNVYNHSVNAGIQKTNIDLSSMPKGMYLVTVSNSNGSLVSKMIIE